MKIKARYDGKVLIPEKPLPVPAGTPVTIQIRLNGESKRRPTRKRKQPLLGLGEFQSGIPDLATNKKHLEGFGK